MSYRPLRLHRSADPLWWCLAAVLGLGCLRLPSLFRVDDEPTRALLGQAAFFFAGVLLGFARPSRVWRWGIASVLLIPLIDLSLAMNGSVFQSVSVLDCLPYLLSRAPSYCVRAAPALMGAYLGAYCAS